MKSARSIGPHTPFLDLLQSALFVASALVTMIGAVGAVILGPVRILASAALVPCLWAAIVVGSALIGIGFWRWGRRLPAVTRIAQPLRQALVAMNIVLVVLFLGAVVGGFLVSWDTKGVVELGGRFYARTRADGSSPFDQLTEVSEWRYRIGVAFPVVLFGALATLVNEAGAIALATRRRVG